MKARDFIAQCGPSALPASVDAYAHQIGGIVKVEPLEEHEDAWSVRLTNGKYRICVNCAHNASRQRFSVCHEVAHVEIGRASCRARGCQDVEVSVVAVSLKKKKNKE